MEEALISAGTVFMLVLVLVAVKYFKKKHNAPTEAVEAIIEAEIVEGIEETVEKVEAIVEEKKKRKRGFNAEALILLFVFLTACVPGIDKSMVQDGIDIVKYFTTNRDSAKVKQPIDSIMVKFSPVYYKVRKSDGITELERDSIINGYSVWELETTNLRRTEVRKLDTIIYLYRK